MKKIKLVVLISLFFFLPIITSAQEIDFPVEELGNCASEEECKAYCDNSDHIEECLKFAVEQGKMTQEKADRILSMEKGELEGPGGCKTKEECKAFCEKDENIDACLQFSIDNGMMTQEKAEKIKERIKQRGPRKERPEEGPGGCTTKEECKAYCDNPDHVEECLEFSVEQGRMTQEEADKVLEKIKKREILREKEKEVDQEFDFEEGPGGCSSKEECNKYCNKFEHLEECLNFEVEQGMMTQEKADKILKKERAKQKEAGNITPGQVNSILQKVGGGPGGCRSQKECDSYCQNKEHAEECVEFAKEHGLMSEEKAEKIKNGLAVGKKLKDQGGPGGCKTKVECKAYCSKEENREECINFGKEHGMMTSEKAKQLKDRIKVERDLQTKGGPGGCSSKEECKAYCSKEENREECLNFGKKQGLIDDQKLKRIKDIQKLKARRDIEMQRKKEMMNQKGEPPEGENIQKKKDMDSSKGPEGYEDMDKKPKDQLPPEDKNKDSGDMIPTDENKKLPNGEELEDVGGFGPQGFIKDLRNFVANLSFITK